MTKQSGSDMSESEHPYPTLRLIRGGKGPPEDNNPPADWLSPLPIGSVFACRKKGQPEKYALMMLQILFKHVKTIIVSDALNSNPNAPIDAAEFCKCHELVEIIQEGDPNGHDLRTVRPPGVENDVDVEAGQPGDDPVGRE